MRIITPFLALLFLAAPHLLAAQDAPSSRLAPTVGIFAGVGSGPIGSATLGVELGVPIWRHVSVRAEYSGWGNGPGGTDCIAMPPESHRCSVSGSAALAGLSADVPVQGPLAVFAEVAGGRFTRDWLEDQKVSSPALSLKAGARLPLGRSISARIGARVLRTQDDDYQTLLGERLQYTMGTIGLEYSFRR